MSKTNLTPAKTIKIKIVSPKRVLPNVKYCRDCDLVKPVEEFYKTGYKQFRGIRCKKCSNKNRKNYSFKKYPYVSKGKVRTIGFFKLPLETQKNIRYDLYVKKGKKKVALEYGINYQTFLYWCKQIPPYEE